MVTSKWRLWIACTVLAMFLCAPGSHAGQSGGNPVKVFILAGQSNMEGHGKVEMGHDNVEGGLGSLRHLVEDPDTAWHYGDLVDANGEWRVRPDVWIWSTTDGGEKGKLTVGYGARDFIGPELGFGRIAGNYYDGPILLIKTAWGGKSLAKDFRPPSSQGETGPYYEKMIKEMKDVLANLGEHFPEFQDREYEIAGFGWHQGWNDLINDDFVKEYEENLANLIRDVRADLEVKDLPVVIANSGFAGWYARGRQRHPGIISAQAAVSDSTKHPEFAGTVATVETRYFWRPAEVSPSGAGYHWNHNAESHMLIGDHMGHAMINLIESRPHFLEHSNAGSAGK